MIGSLKKYKTFNEIYFIACVNCVRWSNDGRYLASGGDDRLVMVWALSVATCAAGKRKTEMWRCISTLRGHAGNFMYTILLVIVTVKS